MCLNALRLAGCVTVLDDRAVKQQRLRNHRPHEPTTVVTNTSLNPLALLLLSRSLHLVAPLSSAHRAAYTAAWSSLLKHAYPLMTSSSVASSSSWLHGFSSLLLQELWSLQLDHALHAAKSTSAPVEDDHRQSTAFALMQAAGKQKKDKKETDAWIAAQASIAADLSAHVEAFATQ